MIDEALKQKWRKNRRERDGRDKQARGMTAAEFARLHGLNDQVLRRRMRAAGYVRKGGAKRVPVKDLEKFLP
jgi:hypothetical protein